MGELIKIEFANVPVARCPECGNTSWHIMLDAFGDQWNHIIGTQCTYCRFIVDWVIAAKDRDEE